MKPTIHSFTDPETDIDMVGGKGMSLTKLVRAGLPVPNGFHITTTAYHQFVTAGGLQPKILAVLNHVDPAQPSTLEVASTAISRLFGEIEIPSDLADAIREAYQVLSADNAPVAVRSSATAEDLPEASFAGQQETYLNIQGVEAVLKAVRECWASLWTGRAIAYRLHHGIPPDIVAQAVIVQLLVPAEAAGILFTANPVTGRRDEIVINCTWGLGEAVVGGAVTPDTITLDKPKCSVIRREIADKQVMTVRTTWGTEEQPVPESLRDKAVLFDSQASELARYGVKIEELYGMPMDIEWALAEHRFAILQARPITTLPPELPTRIEWKLPNPKGQYMRGSIVDMMPDPVHPLFSTMGIKTITQIGIKQVLGPLTRSEPVLPDDYILTINEYAYMSASFTPREWWWILTRMMASFPRLLRESLPLWRDKIRPQYVATIAAWEDKPLEGMTVAEMWAAAQDINLAAMRHLASLLVATTGASAGSEMLFTRVYKKLIQRTGDPEAPTFLVGYNSTPILAEKSLYDMAEWARAHPEMAAHLLNTPSDTLIIQLTSTYFPREDEEKIKDWQELRERFQIHLRTYGHLIYDVDFTKPLPLDDPAPMLETVKMYLQGAGVNPYERQRAAEEKRVSAVDTTLKRLKGLRRWAFQKTLGMAQAMAQVRENAIADIGLGYPLLRRMLCQLGQALVEAGSIAQAQDIFWLFMDEVSQAIASIESGAAPGSLADRVAERKVKHEAVRHVVPPPMLPPKKKYMGIDMGFFTPASEESQTGNSLKGIAASVGHVTAPACVLRGPQDFNLMRAGDVLVAATTTPAWTPLFAMASAVVTDIGGPLSHGSIVAREYGIPAVMGTGVATRRIKNGQTITVDGGSGIVTIPG